MSSTMKSVMSARSGGPETLEVVEAPIPSPGTGEVLIEVAAAGVNFPDTLIIRDLYQVRPPRPFAPGGEVAGVVAACGEGVVGIEPGDRVLAGAPFGGFSTHFVGKAARVHRIPDAMPFEDAAAFMMTFGTSYYALKNRAGLEAGETLFVLGAAGGVGAAAIELGKALGARVVAGVSSKTKAKFCRDIGADDVLIYPGGELDRAAQKELSSQIKEACGADGANVVYDAVGGGYAEPALRSLAWNGRYLVVGFPAGIPKIPLNLVLLKGCQIVGVFWGSHLQREPEQSLRNADELFLWYEEGRIRPRVSKTYPLEDAVRALQDVEARRALGKIVLTVPS